METYKTITITASPDFVDIQGDAGCDTISFHGWGRLKWMDGNDLSIEDAKAIMKGINAVIKQMGLEEKNL